MVFIGGWRPRRRGGGFFGGSGYGPQGYGPGYGYGPPPGYGYRRGGNSCLRDVCLVESGCCLAEALGCGPQLTLVGPSLVRRAIRRTRTGRSVSTSSSAGLSEKVRLTIVAAIELYQSEISPKRRSCCRFTPTCSHYAREALEQHGLRHGLWLGARRLLRCRPGASGGYDPVPAVE